MAEVSSTRLYLGNLPQNATKADIENHFNTHGAGKITEIKLMNGFGFIEYEDSMDARDVVPAFHGSDFMGNRLVVQFARGSRPRETMPYYQERPAPRTRRTIYRMSISGLPTDTSWQDLKDFARLDGLDVVYSEVSRDRDGKGFVEYETAADLKTAVEKIDGREFRGVNVSCVADIQPERPRDRFRSRSPPPRRGYGPSGGYDDYYDRRPPPRGYGPRSPPPQRRGPPPEDYPPPRRGYPDEPYPPPRSYSSRPQYEADPYMNGHRGAYDRPMSPPRRRTPPPPRSYDDGYGRRAY